MTSETLFQLFGYNRTLSKTHPQNDNLKLEYYQMCKNELINSFQKNLSSECSIFFINPNDTNTVDSMKTIINSTIMDTKSEKSFQFHQPWNIQLIWSLIFGIMILFAVLGNLMVICIITTHRSMRTVTNYFLLNLTIADLVTIIFNATFNYIFMLNGHWPFGRLYCVVNNFITNLTIAASVFTITITSIDRYIAIVHPLNPRMTKRKAITTIIIIWLSASLFALPTLIYSETLSISYDKDTTRTLCLLYWPDGEAGQSTFDFIYNITFLLLTYIVPMTTMAIAYSLMGRVLWGSQGIGEVTQVQQGLIRSKQKVVRMLICVVSVFGICWLPYHAYFLCTYQWPQIIVSEFIQHIYLAIYWLAMANSMFNPIILLVMNKRYRRYSFRIMPCVKDRENDSDFRTATALNKRISNNRFKSTEEVEL